MLELSNALEAIRDFLELGGPVLRLIAWVILFMWILILERLIFFRTGLKAPVSYTHLTLPTTPYV